MNYILFDTDAWNQCKPLTFTKPVSEIRCGILTIREKWEYFVQNTCSHLTQGYLQKKYPCVSSKKNICIAGSVLPNNAVVKLICNLELNQALSYKGELLAVCISEQDVLRFTPEAYLSQAREVTIPVERIVYPWDIFTHNAKQIESDFELLTYDKTSQKISETNTCIAPENIFIEEGARVECAVLNAQNGKIYIGKDAEIMEGALIRGPFALCEHASVKMGAKIYEGTTIGPYSKVGGEVQNSVIFGYSNKGHDGYLGNSVLGEWCNLGADTNNSNLKNDYSEVRVWNYPTERFAKTGLQFCGLIMGDHSKSAINTMFNTGTVVGVSANVFGAGFPRNFTPSFSWGGPQGLEVYSLNKAVEVAKRVYARRSLDFSDVEIDILAHIFKETEKYRRF